jgi:hypothetical protein
MPHPTPQKVQVVILCAMLTVAPVRPAIRRRVYMHINPPVAAKCAATLARPKPLLSNNSILSRSTTIHNQEFEHVNLFCKSGEERSAK